MANGTEDLTPPQGTAASPTPPEGTATSPDAGGEAEPAPEPNYKQKFSDSSREAQRLYQEKQRVEQENLQLRTLLSQAQTQPVKTQQPVHEESDADFYARFSDGVLDRKPEVIRSLEDRAVERAKRELMSDMTAQTSKQARIQSSLTYLQSEIKDPHSPLAQQAMNRYQELMLDPSFSLLKSDEIDYNGAKFNPHVMRIAVTETKARLGAGLMDTAAAARAEGEYFVEPSRTTQTPAKKNDFNATKHLFDYERDYVERNPAYRDDKGNIQYSRYFNYMDPKIKEARLKAGKPLKRNQI